MTEALALKYQTKAKWLIILGIILTPILTGTLFTLSPYFMDAADTDVFLFYIGLPVFIFGDIAIIIGYLYIHKEASPLGKTVSKYIILANAVVFFINISYYFIHTIFDITLNCIAPIITLLYLTEIACWCIFWNKPNVSKKVKRSLYFIVVMPILKNIIFVAMLLVDLNYRSNYDEQVHTDQAFTTYYYFTSTVPIITFFAGIFFLFHLYRLLSSNIFYSGEGSIEPTPKYPSIKSIVTILSSMAIGIGILYFSINFFIFY